MEMKAQVFIDYQGEGDYDQKYIIIKIHQEHSGNQFALVSKKERYHSRISGAFSRETGWKYTVQGGGLLKIEPELKKISTYGTSGGYGDPDIDIVESLLRPFVEDYYPGWDLDVKVTDHVRD